MLTNSRKQILFISNFELLFIIKLEILLYEYNTFAQRRANSIRSLIFYYIFHDKATFFKSIIPKSTLVRF